MVIDYRPEKVFSIDLACNPFEGVLFETEALAMKYLMYHLNFLGVGPGSAEDWIGSGRAAVIAAPVVVE